MDESISGQITRPKRNEKEFSNALSALDLNKEDVFDSCLLSYDRKGKNISDRVTKINEIAFNYKMVLEGKTFHEEKGGFLQMGKALASKKFIDLSYGLISNYATASNLMTTKEKNFFYVQAWDSWRKINRSLVLRDRAIPEKNTRLILKLFKDALINIGEIILGSKENIDKVFDKINQNPEDYHNVEMGF